MIYKNQNNNNFQSFSEITKERDELKEKIANIEFLTIALEEIFLFRVNNDNIWKIYTKAIQEIIKGKEAFLILVMDRVDGNQFTWKQHP